MNAKYIDFFLGANTAIGFVSRYDQISENNKLKKIYVIKGGAGTGKSSMMKKIGEEFFSSGETVERIHCSSDPDSLDSVIVEDKGFAILDGTPPHPMEPKYPGAQETIVSLYPCWDEKMLEEKLEQIKESVKKYTDCHKKACSYLSVAAALLDENRKLADGSIDYAKVERYAENIAKKEFGKFKGENGKETVRFFSAVTPKGVKFYNITLETMCDKVYIVEDDIGCVSQHFVKTIKKQAVDRGFDVICGYCITSPYDRLEHIILPQLKLAFVTSNKFHKIVFSKAYRTIKVYRFTDLNGLSKKKLTIAFNKKAAKLFVNEATKAIKEAKEYHDVLEKYYINAVDFKKVDKLKNEILQKLKPKT